MNNYFENYRNKYGQKAFCEIYENSLKTDKINAVITLNRQKITFPTLFVLFELLEKYSVLNLLSFRNLYAYYLYKKQKDTYNHLICSKNAEFNNVLRWIFANSVKNDGLSDEYDELIDYVISLLIIDFDDLSILPEVCQLIFIRNRKNELNHDLLWVYFKATTKENLLLIANFLKSSNKVDRDFAYELLSDFDEEDDKTADYNYWKNWLLENNDFLIYSNENYNLTTNPKTFMVDYDYKFLGNNDFKSENDEILEKFHKLDKTQKHKLCHDNYIQNKSKNIPNFNKLSQNVNSLDKEKFGGLL